MRSSRRADERRSSSSRRRCRCPGHRRMRGSRRSPSRSQSSSGAGVPDERQTILVAGGLGRRFGQRDLERASLPSAGQRVPRPRPRPRRRGRGARPDRRRTAASTRRSSRPISCSQSPQPRRSCTAGPARSSPRATRRRSERTASRRLAARGVRLARLGSRARARGGASRRVSALAGVSLVLDLPRLTGTFRGYPRRPGTVARLRSISAASDVLASPTRAAAGPPRRRAAAWRRRAPSRARRRSLTRRPCCAASPCAGPRSTSRSTRSSSGVPWIGPHVPREPLNPITVGRGRARPRTAPAARRLPDPARTGSLVLVHPLTRSFAHGTQAPYAAMFNALRTVRGDRTSSTEAERAAAVDERALDAHTEPGRACHPLLPYADWAGCAPALSRLGRVIVAGCRDAAAARTLGFVPSHGIASALEMAHGVAERPRPGRDPARAALRAPARGLSYLLRFSVRPHPDERGRQPDQHDHAAREDGDVGDVERVRARADEVGDQAEARAVDEVAEAAADEQPETRARASTRARDPAGRGTRTARARPIIASTASGSARASSPPPATPEVLDVMDRVRAEEMRSLTRLEMSCGRSP